MATPIPVAPESNGKSFIKRELNGATFLTLEHVAHMALVVIVAALIVSGLCSALSMWFGSNAMAGTMFLGSAGMLGGAGMQAAESMVSLGIVAALLVLTPALVILDRRTRAEWNKRRGYAGRLAYKAPVYAALGVLGALFVTAKIQALYVIITSLASIGASSAPIIGGMYVSNFIPALLGMAVFGAALWYVFNLAKGRDNGRKFSMSVALTSGVIVLALFITSLVVLHDNKSFTPAGTDSGASTQQDPAYDEDYYRELLNKYSR